MRHPRPFLALLAVAALTVACSSTGGESPGQSNGGGGGGGEATATPDGGGEATATPAGGGGGGGGGGGANGSITYNISGDYEASGELPFLALGLSTWIESEGGWVANFAQESGEGAYILMNTQTRGQILTFGDGTVVIAAASGESTGYDCTFNMTRNDSGGLSGSMECNDIFGSNATTGALITVDISAEWDAHP
ncbi:MAG: hypothetical protein ABIQ05_09410 [Candidatus Limnocylindria bacterium]